jgi:hypothetical protein
MGRYSELRTKRQFRTTPLYTKPWDSWRMRSVRPRSEGKSQCDWRLQKSLSLHWTDRTRRTWNSHAPSRGAILGVKGIATSVQAPFYPRCGPILRKRCCTNPCCRLEEFRGTLRRSFEVSTRGLAAEETALSARAGKGLDLAAFGSTLDRRRQVESDLRSPLGARGTSRREVDFEGLRPRD